MSILNIIQWKVNKIGVEIVKLELQKFRSEYFYEPLYIYINITCN